MELPVIREGLGLVLIVGFFCTGLLCGAAVAGEPGQRPVDNPTPGPEAVDRRTVDSKHFDLGGGRYEARISTAPLHYLENDGRWCDIDTSLAPQGDDRFVADKNGLRVDLPAVFRGAVEVWRRPQSIDELASSAAADGGQWTARFTPIGIRSVDGEVHHDLAFFDDRPAASVDGAALDFGEVASGVSVSYRVIPNGLRLQLTVNTTPEGLALIDSGRFEFVCSLDLPQGVALRPAGEVAGGAFTTEESIEVVDGEGGNLLVFTAPEAHERDRPHESVRGALSVSPGGSGAQLVVAVPAAWLSEPGREGPIAVGVEVTIQPPSADTFLSAGLGPMGTFEQLWVGNDGFFTPSRTLLSWYSLAAIPRYAVLDHDDDYDTRVRLYLTDYWGDGDGQYIRVYRLEDIWDEVDADWLHRVSTELWSTPGGDFGSLQGLGYVTTSNGFKSFAGLGIRDSVALWRTCLIAEPICTAGEFPFGFLLKLPDPEEGRDMKYFASRENPEPSLAPQLVVTYTDGPLALADQTPHRRRVPSPDYFETPTSGLWRVVGIRPQDSDTRYDLIVHTSDSYTSYIQASTNGPGEVDLVVIGQDAPQLTYYPQVFTPNTDTGYYRIEFVQRISYFATGIQPGDAFGPYTMHTTNVVKLWSMLPSVASETCIRVEPMSGDSQLGIAVFAPESLYSDLDDALVSDVASSAGEDASVAFTASTVDVHGLLVWNLGATSHTDFMIRGCGGEIFSDGFESGNTSGWE